MTAYIKMLIVTVAMLIGFVAGYYTAHERGEVKLAAITTADAKAAAQASAQLAAATQAARAKEQLAADTMAAIDAQHQKDMTDARASADRTIADLRAGTLRLRAAWSGCPAVPGAAKAAASASQPDAAANDRAASAGRIVRAADDADATIRALQAVVKADRQ